MSWLPGGFNEGDLLFVGDWSRGAVLLFVTLAVGVLALTWLDVRELRRSRGVTLVGLRACTLALAIALLLEPAIELRQVTRVRNQVPVLVDVSGSMNLPLGQGGGTRWDVVRDSLRELAQEWTADDPDHVFEYVAVSDSPLSTTSEELVAEGLLPTGSRTRLLDALTDLDARYTRAELGGIVLMSDGIDNDELGGRVRRGDPLDAETLSLLTRIGVPIHTVAVAPDDSLTDLAVARVLHDEFAFVRNAVNVNVDIRNTGYVDGTVQVVLRREGQVLQTRTVTLNGDATVYPLEFEFVPELLGKEIYSVELQPLAGDAVAENNRQFFVLNIIRDRIRVLQVVGRPSWDVRFLRQLLKGNPNVDLISFFILRTADDMMRAANDEMSLIPFPTDELFDRQLPSFDLVIFHNFTFEPYNMRQYLPDVRDYVMGGGGFVMIGGDQSFSVGGYASTEIADILPVRLPGGRSETTLVDTGLFRPVLTEAGQRHPMTRLAFDRAENRTLWESLPEMHGTNLVLEPMDGATVLATHPSRQVNGEPMPVVTVSDMGRGRTMAMTFDGAWRWNFEYVGEGGSSRPYSTFWNAAIRWLIRDPELNLVQVELPDETVAPGSELQGQVRMFGVDYRPAAQTAGTLTIRRRDLEQLGTDAGTVVHTQPFVTDDRGRFDIRWPVVEAGAYVVEATAEIEEGTPLSDTEVFLAIAESMELREIEPRNDLLRALSEATGGRHLQLPDDTVSRLPLQEARIEQVNRRRVVQVWSSPLVLVVLAALLALEWSLRRRWGRL
ncbi:MAG: VWA domain-containing protein [Myxococcales bacterium]|nr:VWA domain-containing protein [Myxococcales bacterium]